MISIVFQPAARVSFVLMSLCLTFNSLAVAQISAPTEHVPLTQFQLIARADLVVHVVVKDGAQRYAMVDVLETIRGVSPEEHLRIDFRDLNLQLRGQELIVFTTGEEYVLFLERPSWRKPKEKNRDIFALFHARRGRMLLPPEGLGVPLEAVRLLAQVVDRPPEDQVESLRALMVRPNPALREAVLEEMSRMRAFSIGDLGALSTLSRDPLPSIRGRALQAIGTALKDPGDEMAQEPRRLALELCRERARNDAVAAVRVQAIRAIGSWQPREEVIPDLRAIAVGDSDQMVRYEAERLLFVWRLPENTR